MSAALAPAPTATFNGLLAALMEVSNSSRELSIRPVSPADGTPPEEFLAEVERRYRLPKAWQRMLRPQRQAAAEAYLAEVEKLKRKSRKGTPAHD